MAKFGKTINDVIRGDTRRVNTEFFDTDGTTPLDLTNGTVYFTVNASDNPSDDTSASIKKVITSFDDPTTGTQVVTLSTTDTDITPGTYWYDSQFVDSVGNKVSSYRGRFIVQSDITRS